MARSTKQHKPQRKKTDLRNDVIIKRHVRALSDEMSEELADVLAELIVYHIKANTKEDSECLSPK